MLLHLNRVLQYNSERLKEVLHEFYLVVYGLILPQRQMEQLPMHIVLVSLLPELLELVLAQVEESVAPKCRWVGT